MVISSYLTYGITIGVMGAVLLYIFYSYVWKIFGFGKLFWYMFSRKSIAQVRDFLVKNPSFNNMTSEEKILLLSKSPITQFSPLFISEIIKRELGGNNGNKKRRFDWKRKSKGNTSPTGNTGTASPSPAPEPAPANPSELAGDGKQVEPHRDSKLGENIPASADYFGAEKDTGYFD
jgi:hypothetical protein